MSERTGEHDAACGGCRQRPCVCETVALPKAGDWFWETPESLAALAEERAQLEAAEAIVAKARCRVSGETAQMFLAAFATEESKRPWLKS